MKNSFLGGVIIIKVRKILFCFIVFSAILSISGCSLNNNTVQNNKPDSSVNPTQLAKQPLSESEFTGILADAREIIINIAKSGAAQEYIDSLNAAIVRLDSSEPVSEITEKVKGATDLLRTIISYDSSEIEEKALKTSYENYISTFGNDALNLTKLDYYLAVVAIREKSRLNDKEAVLSFVGDCSFGTYPEAKKENHFDYVFENVAKGDFEYFFKNCHAFFRTDDLTIANNETAITIRTKMQNKLWRIKSDPMYTKLYPMTDIEVVNLANNHTYDCFKEGYDDTLESLEDNNVEYFDADHVLIKEIKGLQFVFIGYDIRQSQVSPSAKQEVIDAIKRHKTENNFVVANIHWGREYSEQPLAYQKEYAYAFLDAGADLIIGSHPHIMQGIEKYKDKYIVYSMGDFLFGADPDLESRDTSIFRIRVNTETKKVALEIYPFFENSDGVKSGYNNFQPLPLFGNETDTIFSYLKRISEPLEYGVTEYTTFNPF